MGYGSFGRGDDHAGRDVYRAGRDQNFYGVNGPAFILETPPDAPPPTLAELAALRHQPSLLLNARRKVVAFTGRTDELAAIQEWRGQAVRQGVWLVHAPGGQGKSRLAAHAGEEAVAAGWSVVHARHRTETPGDEQRVTLDDLADRPLLVIIDYAERLPLEDLCGLVQDLARYNGRLRVLLLARSITWWPAISAECENLAMVIREPLLLQALAGTPADRRQLFDDVCRRFAEIYELAALPPSEPAGKLNDSLYGVTLGLHMAALAAVDAYANKQQPPVNSADLSRYLLDRERRYWARLHGAGSTLTAARCVFVAALAGAQLQADGAALLNRVGLPQASACTAQKLLDDHARCYPPVDANNVLEPIYPDRLAEDFIALTLPKAVPTGHEDAWAADLIVTSRRLNGHNDERPGLLFDQGGEVPAYAGRALIFLAAASARSSYTRGLLGKLLALDPRLVIKTGGATLLAVVPHLEEAVARAISDHTPQHDIAFDPAAAVLTERIVHLSAVTATPDQHAKDLVLLAVRLAHAGRWNAALTSAEEAIDIQRRLVRVDPAAHLSDLAAALTCLGACLRQVGRPEEALAPAEEVIAIRRCLFFNQPAPHLANPVLYLADLARALNNLGNRLAELGRWNEAMASMEEAVTIRRRLASAYPATYLPELAASVNNLGGFLTRVGRWGEALNPAEEAAGIYRHLADADPAAYLPDLAMSVHNHSVSLFQAGYADEALAAAEEAIAIRRRLADTNRAAYLPDLATSLSHLGGVLIAVGRRHEAPAPTEEATSIYRQLAETHSAAYLPHLAGSLHNLGAALSQVGRRDQALATAREAITIRRRLTEANPAAHQPELARSLLSYAWACVDLGDNFSEALATINEAIAIYEILAPELPQLVPAQLEVAHNVLAVVLGQLGPVHHRAKV